MRVLVVVAALCAFLVPAAAQACPSSSDCHSAFWRMAPADEYFGRHKESVLEIRNRLDAFDRRSDEEMLDPGTRHALDDLQDAIRDWQHKYPGDPWLPRMLQRLVRDYQRAGAASAAPAVETAASLAALEPPAATVDETADDAPPADAPPQGVRIAGTVVDADTGDPIPGAMVAVSAGGDDVDTDAVPNATTGDDGSFVVDGAPATTIQLVVEPPIDSGYAPYAVTLDASSGDVDAGVIRLADADDSGLRFF